MTRGFVRVGVVVVLFTWIVAAFLQWKHVEGDIWQIKQHISPNLSGNILAAYGWPWYAAKPAFLALPSDERVEAAARYYANRVRPLERLYSVGSLEQWMAETARLTVSEAPIEYLSVGHSEQRLPYRRFDLPGIVVTPRLSYILFSDAVMIATPLISVGVIVALILITATVRWVYRGFSKSGDA